MKFSAIRPSWLDLGRIPEVASIVECGMRVNRLVACCSIRRAKLAEVAMLCLSGHLDAQKSIMKLDSRLVKSFTVHDVRLKWRLYQVVYLCDSLVAYCPIWIGQVA